MLAGQRPVKTVRYHNLDAFRTLLMSLGFLFHAAVFLSSDKWFGGRQPPARVFTGLIVILHSFRMQGFYLISGFFSIMLLGKYGGKAFMKNRLLRLGIPLFLVGLTFNTIVKVILNLKEHAEPLSVIFSIHYFTGGDFQIHLWFLPNLIWFCCLLVLVAHLFPALVRRCREHHFSIAHAYFLLIFLAIALAIFRKLFHEFLFGNWFIFSVFRFAYYLPFFILGVVFYLNKDGFVKFTKAAAWNACILLLAILLFFAAGILPYAKYAKYVLEFPIALSTNGILLMLMGRFFNARSRSSRFLSDASYTMYLLHVPIMVCSMLGLARTHMPLWSHFVISVTVTWLVTYLFHTMVVRRVPILSLAFNGQKPKEIE